MPRVSVIIPSYNSAKFIRDSIASILNQTLQDFELIIVDDGSTDHSPELVAELSDRDDRILLIRKEHQGIPHSLNAGIAVAQGKYIARLDADDVARPERLEKQAALLDANPETVACGCLIQNTTETLKPIGIPSLKARTLSHDPMAFPPKIAWIYGPTPMVRADALRQIGGFRGMFLVANDRDLCWRLGALGQMEIIPEVLVDRRVHDSNISKQKRQLQLHFAFISDLSAIAAAKNLDDQEALRMMSESRDFREIVAWYQDTVGKYYPVYAYLLTFFARYSAWEAAGFRSRWSLMAALLKEFVSHPLDARRWTMMRKGTHYVLRGRQPSDI